VSRTRKVALDTSCVVPLFCEWHERHERTMRSVSERPARMVFLSSHVLLESFAVLTRLPHPFRLSSSTAESLLLENFGSSIATGEVLWADAVRGIRSVVESGGRGGKVYDAVIAEAAARSGASLLLTWNVRDFASVAPPGLEVREP